MSNYEVHPTTINGIKRLASKIKKKELVKHTEALDRAAKSANFSNYRHALRALPMIVDTVGKHCLFLTVYWRSADSGAVGRETLELTLSKPILEICSKPDLKRVQGFTHMRMVASDHFVCDFVADSQNYARTVICKAVCALRFMEYTGLRPFRDRRRNYPGDLPKERLPGTDHATDWIEPESGQFILIDEPYGGGTNDEARQEWARQHGWRLSKSAWPGMYFPYECSLYVGTDVSRGFNFERLMQKIDTIPAPIMPEPWLGESAATLDVFVSPAARTPQDRRRARSKGTIMPVRSATTAPYRMVFGSTERRPLGSMSITQHAEAGRLIALVLKSQRRFSRVYRYLDSVRTTLENWLGCEVSRKQLDGPAFFNVYFGKEDIEERQDGAPPTSEILLEILSELRELLISSYPNCAPLRAQIGRIDAAVIAIQKQPR